MAFQFDDEERDAILELLSDREGPSFSLQEKEVRLESASVVTALVPINDTSADTYIGHQTLADRARLVEIARGTEGSCLEYLSNIRRHLAALGVVDSAVEMLWSEVTGT